MRRLLAESYARASRLLETHRKDLDTIANGLIQYETLSGGEIVDLLQGKKIEAKSSGQRSQRPSRELKDIPMPVSKGVSSSSGSSSGGKTAAKPLSTPVPVVAPGSGKPQQAAPNSKNFSGAHPVAVPVKAVTATTTTATTSVAATATTGKGKQENGPTAGAGAGTGAGTGAAPKANS